MRIAVADDDKEALDYAMGVLERAGHTCIGFARGHGCSPSAPMAQILGCDLRSVGASS
jgi:hypothetical protein